MPIDPPPTRALGCLLWLRIKDQMFFASNSLIDEVDSLDRQDITEQIVDSGVIAIIRTEETDKIHSVVDAILTGGVSCIEITMTTPGALELIEEVAGARGKEADLLLGAGSVLDAETARRVATVGAQYIVSPIFKEEIVEAAHQQGIPAIPGAFTPSEIQRAYEAGADLIKVFPASTIGPSYLSSVRAPLPHLQLVPTGGVTAENAGGWIEAGASAVGVGSALIDEKAVATDHFDQLTENARNLHRAVATAREA